MKSKPKSKKPTKVRKGAQIYDFGNKEDKDLIKSYIDNTPADIRVWRMNGML